MGASERNQPTIQYIDGFKLGARDKLAGVALVHSDANGVLNKVSQATPLPVSILGNITIVATGLATQATLAAILAAMGTAANQTTMIAALNNILAALTPASSTFDSFGDLKTVTAGTRVQGSAQATPKGVVLSAFQSNSSQVYIGGAAVTNSGGAQRGLTLMPGQQSPILQVSNLNEIYIDSDVNAEGVGVIIL